MNNLDRLQKVIAHSGFCSRRHAEELITDGAVKVNNNVIKTLGTKVGPDDIIHINDKILKNDNSKIYLMLHKPRNCLSTTKDPKRRITIMKFLSRVKTRVYPVGRLDYDTSGFLIITNDGDLTNNLTHPKHKVYKTYEVLVDRIITSEDLKKLEQGVIIDETFQTAPAYTTMIKTSSVENTSMFELSIREGHNHQVKKMVMAIGCNTIRLKRISIGNIVLDPKLRPGQYRELTQQELKSLQKINYKK